MYNSKSLIVLIFLTTFFTACNNDDNDDNSYEIYTKADLGLLHNDSAKTWKLEAYYQNYDNRLSEQNDCFIDDTYIFKTENEVIEVINGSENCYYGSDEIAEAKYTFYEETGFVFLTMIRGLVTSDLNKSKSFSLKLIELKDNRMVFASGDKGNYKIALIFVSN